MLVSRGLHGIAVRARFNKSKTRFLQCCSNCHTNDLSYSHIVIHFVCRSPYSAAGTAERSTPRRRLESRRAEGPVRRVRSIANTDCPHCRCVERRADGVLCCTGKERAGSKPRRCSALLRSSVPSPGLNNSCRRCDAVSQRAPLAPAARVPWLCLKNSATRLVGRLNEQPYRLRQKLTQSSRHVRVS